MVERPFRYSQISAITGREDRHVERDRTCRSTCYHFGAASFYRRWGHGGQLVPSLFVSKHELTGASSAYLGTKRAAVRSAASLSNCSTTCEYRSPVILTLLWPSRLLMASRGTPAARPAVAAP